MKIDAILGTRPVRLTAIIATQELVIEDAKSGDFISKLAAPSGVVAMDGLSLLVGDTRFAPSHPKSDELVNLCKYLGGVSGHAATVASAAADPSSLTGDASARLDDAVSQYASGAISAETLAKVEKALRSNQNVRGPEGPGESVQIKEPTSVPPQVSSQAVHPALHTDAPPTTRINPDGSQRSAPVHRALPTYAPPTKPVSTSTSSSGKATLIALAVVAAVALAVVYLNNKGTDSHSDSSSKPVTQSACDRLIDISNQLKNLPAGADPTPMLFEAADLLPSDWSITAVALRDDAVTGTWFYSDDRIRSYTSKRC